MSGRLEIKRDNDENDGSRTKTTDYSRSQLNGTGGDKPGENHRRNVVAFNGWNRGMRDCPLIGCQETTGRKGCGCGQPQNAGNAMERQGGKN